MGRFSFSPGVCPSQWTYYQMATEIWYNKDKHGYTQSTAYCCSRSALAILLFSSAWQTVTTEELTLTLYSGFSLSRNLTNLSNIKASCTRTLTPGETTITGTLSHGKGAQVLFTAGIQVHQAWAVSWSGSDTATLSPSLPTLTNSMVVPTWVPGEIIPPGKWDRGHDGSDMGNWQPLVHFIMIGVPIIGVAILALGIWCCIRCRRARREERRQRGVLAEPQGIDTTPPPYSK
ncbi:hypothetical protein CDV55_103487 [Aspergillus turcosus]|nr:hypothetical protein CDV55_103487 [Aspergillus turcosus]